MECEILKKFNGNRVVTRATQKNRGKCGGSLSLCTIGKLSEPMKY
jgi:hypothetical protein